MSVDMWRFSEDINTARRFNAVARMQPHCPVLYSGNAFLSFISYFIREILGICLKIMILHAYLNPVK